MTLPYNALVALGVIVLVLVIVLIARIVSIRIEYRNYNKGICRKCRTRLMFFSFDGWLSRGYKCVKCGDTIWVSYNFIDKFPLGRLIDYIDTEKYNNETKENEEEQTNDLS